MTGELEKKKISQSRKKKLKKISQYCRNDLLSSCKVFLFIMSDSKLVQIAFIDAASHLPPPLHLLWCHPARGETEEKNHAAVAFAPFLLILLKSGPTDDETFLPFSGSLWKRFLIFTAGKKRPLACASSRPRIRSYHISRNENKRHDHFQKMSSTYHSVSVCVCVLVRRRMRWGSSRMWDPLLLLLFLFLLLLLRQPWPGAAASSSLIQTRTK